MSAGTHRELDDMLGRGWRKPPLIRNTALRWGLLAGFVIYLIAAVSTIPVDWGRVYEGLDRGWAFVLAFTQPDFVTRWTDIWEGLSESIIMTVAASVVGIAISIPIGLGAARNIAPCPSTWSAAPSSPSAARCKRSSWRSCWWRSSASARWRAS